MSKFILGIVFQFLCGLLIIIFNKPFAQIAANQQTRLGFTYGKKELRVTRVLAILVGVAIILLGIFELYINHV